MLDLGPSDPGMSDLKMYDFIMSGLGPGRAPMLAATRFCFYLTFLAVVVFAFSVPSVAQFQGVPPGQFQGVPTIPFQGVPPASFGIHANAGTYFSGCCANFFLPSGFSPLVPVPSLAEEHHRHHHHKDEALGAVAEPVYIPYAVPYAVDADDDTADNQDSTEPASGGSEAANREGAAKRSSNRQETGQDLDGNSSVNSRSDAESQTGYEAGPDSAPAETAPEKPEEPVVAQPTTVLVFKDGHRSGVVNYAIVGDTLFDFADGRARKILLADLDLAATRKANDDLGVEFKLPPASK